MASSPQSSDSKSLPFNKKKIKVRKLKSDSSSNSSISTEDDSEDYVPLAARDSKWVGLNVCNSDLLLYSSENEASTEEVVIMEVNEEDELPIYSLFPLLRNTPPEKKQLVSSNESTADITKLLVGQKPDFTHMKKSKRFSPAKQSLPKLEEVPNEEKISESKLSKLSSRIGTSSFLISRGSESSNSSKETPYDDESDLEHRNVKKRKKSKKKSTILLDIDTGSSYSGIVHRAKQTPSVVAKTSKTIHKNLSNGNLADEDN